MTVFNYENTLLLVLTFVSLAVKIFAFASAMTFPTDAFPAASKGTKVAWGIGLGLGVALQLVLSPINFIGIGFTVAALVYLADVRPALASLRRR